MAKKQDFGSELSGSIKSGNRKKYEQKKRKNVEGVHAEGIKHKIVDPYRRGMAGDAAAIQESIKDFAEEETLDVIQEDLGADFDESTVRGYEEDTEKEMSLGENVKVAEVIEKLKNAGASKEDLQRVFRMNKEELEGFMNSSDDEMRVKLVEMRQLKEVESEIKEMEIEKRKWKELEKFFSEAESIGELMIRIYNKEDELQYMGVKYDAEDIIITINSIKERVATLDKLPSVFRRLVEEVLIKEAKKIKEDIESGLITMDDLSDEEKNEEMKRIESMKRVTTGKPATIGGSDVLDLGNPEDWEPTEIQPVAGGSELLAGFAEARGKREGAVEMDLETKQQMERLENLKRVMEENRRRYVEMDRKIDSEASGFRKFFGLSKIDMGRSRTDSDLIRSTYQGSVAEYHKALVESGKFNDKDVVGLVVSEKASAASERSRQEMEANPKWEKMKKIALGAIEDYKKIPTKRKIVYGLSLAAVGASAASGGAVVAGAAGAVIAAKRAFGSLAFGLGVKMSLEAKDESLAKKVAEQELEVMTKGAEGEERAKNILEFIEMKSMELDEVIQKGKQQEFWNTFKGIAAGMAMGGITQYFSGMETIEAAPVDASHVHGAIESSVVAHPIEGGIESPTPGEVLPGHETTGHEIANPETQEAAPYKGDAAVETPSNISEVVEGGPFSFLGELDGVTEASNEGIATLESLKAGESVEGKIIDFLKSNQDYLGVSEQEWGTMAHNLATTFEGSSGIDLDNVQVGTEMNLRFFEDGSFEIESIGGEGPIVAEGVNVESVTEGLTEKGVEFSLQIDNPVDKMVFFARESGLKPEDFAELKDVSIETILNNPTGEYQEAMAKFLMDKVSPEDYSATVEYFAKNGDWAPGMWNDTEMYTGDYAEIIGEVSAVDAKNIMEMTRTMNELDFAGIQNDVNEKVGMIVEPGETKIQWVIRAAKNANIHGVNIVEIVRSHTR